MVLDSIVTVKYICRYKNEKNLTSYPRYDEKKSTNIVIPNLIVVLMFEICYWKESATKYLISVMLQNISVTRKSKMTQTGEHKSYTINSNMHI